MLRAIHFNNEFGVTREEVNDVALPEHDLPAKRGTELAGAKCQPQPRFRGGQTPPHAVSASREKLLTFAALLSRVV